jgi:insulysin
LATAKNRAIASIIDNFMNQPYYTKMRTRQQLGYLVWSFTNENQDSMFGVFIIQSADYSADELLNRSTTFLSTLPALFDELSNDKLEIIRAGVRAKLEQKDKSIAERGARFFGLAFEEDENWSQTNDTIKALEILTREDIASTLKTITDPAISKSYTVLSFAKQHAQKRAAVKVSFDDIRCLEKNSELLVNQRVKQQSVKSPVNRITWFGFTRVLF